MTLLDYYNTRYTTSSSTYSSPPFPDSYTSKQKFKVMLDEMFIMDKKIEKDIEDIQEDKKEEVFFNPENLDI